MAPLDLHPAIARGTQGLGLQIDANELSRLCTKADAYALCGDADLYSATLELISDRLTAMARLAPALAGKIAVAPFETLEAA